MFFIIFYTNLKNLKCDNCRLLTTLPKCENIISHNCYWLIHDKKIEYLIKLQKYIKNYILAKKINNIILVISEIYYSPDCKGGKAAIYRLEQNK